MAWTITIRKVRVYSLEADSGERNGEKEKVDFQHALRPHIDWLIHEDKVSVINSLG